MYGYHAAMRAPYLQCLLIAAGLCVSTDGAATVSPTLPELGDSSSAIVSLDMEQEIGKQLLREVNAQVPTVRDPILKYFTEMQLYSLAEHSELKRKQLFPVLIDAQEVNAFAAPGGTSPFWLRSLLFFRLPASSFACASACLS